jgi:hypothetical protein
MADLIQARAESMIRGCVMGLPDNTKVVFAADGTAEMTAEQFDVVAHHVHDLRKIGQDAEETPSVGEPESEEAAPPAEVKVVDEPAEPETAETDDLAEPEPVAQAPEPPVEADPPAATREPKHTRTSKGRGGKRK